MLTNAGYIRIIPLSQAHANQLSFVLCIFHNAQGAADINHLVYRADWEPEAPSGKCMAGVFWRCPAALQGPSTHNPALVAGKPILQENPYFQKLADFPYMHVEMGWICPIWPSARFVTKLAPMCKKPCCLAVPLIKG